jgi:hypothetical protein
MQLQRNSYIRAEGLGIGVVHHLDVCQLDFSVMHCTLKAEQPGAIPPRGGQQWWMGRSDRG